MNKTPFEIRLELLKLAKDILHAPIASQRDLSLSKWYQLTDNLKGKEVSEIPDFPDFPDFPTTADIIAEAEKLNKFVSKG